MYYFPIETGPVVTRCFVVIAYSIGSLRHTLNPRVPTTNAAVHEPSLFVGVLSLTEYAPAGIHAADLCRLPRISRGGLALLEPRTIHSA